MKKLLCSATLVGAALGVSAAPSNAGGIVTATKATIVCVTKEELRDKRLGQDDPEDACMVLDAGEQADLVAREGRVIELEYGDFAGWGIAADWK